MPAPSDHALRLFVAVEFSPAVRQALGELAGRLAAAAPERAVAWVRPALIHLTLKFLGDTPEASLPQLAAALDSLAARLPAFSIATAGLGGFPDLRRPRVIWIGLASEPADQLAGLAAGVESALVPLGFPTEARPFAPHLTLGRVRREAPAAQAARVGEAVGAATAPRRLSDSIGSIVLMNSELQRGGPVHTALHRAALRGGG